MLRENELKFEKQTDFSIASSQSQLPKDHHWLLILENMKIKGIADSFKFVYGNEISDKIKKFAYDEEKGGIGVVRPDKVLLIKKKREGYLIEDEVVGEIDFRRHVDPDFNESMVILDVLKRIE
jgi:hypothetical protein